LEMGQALLPADNFLRLLMYAYSQRMDITPILMVWSIPMEIHFRMLISEYASFHQTRLTSNITLVD